MEHFRIAVVDDDPVEHLLIREITQDLAISVEVACFDSVEAFTASKDTGFSHVFLDRRIPPHAEYTDTLPLIAMTGFAGKVVLMTAHDPGLETGSYAFALVGPVDKLDLIQPDTFTAILRGQELAA